MLCLKENENYEKKKEFRYKERNREERIKYYQALRILINTHGSKAFYLLMNQDLNSFMLVFMRGQKKEKKYMVIDKENGEKEKI